MYTILSNENLYFALLPAPFGRRSVGSGQLQSNLIHARDSQYSLHYSNSCVTFTASLALTAASLVATAPKKWRPIPSNTIGDTSSMTWRATALAALSARRLGRLRTRFWLYSRSGPVRCPAGSAEERGGLCERHPPCRDGEETCRLYHTWTLRKTGLLLLCETQLGDPSYFFEYSSADCMRKQSCEEPLK